MWDFMRWPHCSRPVGKTLECLSTMNNRLYGLYACYCWVHKSWQHSFFWKKKVAPPPQKKNQQCQVPISRTAAPPQPHVPLKKIGEFLDFQELWLPELSGERDRPRRLVCPSYLGCLVAMPTSTSNLKRLTSVPWSPWRVGGLEGWRGEGNLMSSVVICPLGWWQLEKRTYINWRNQRGLKAAKRFTS